MYRKLLVSIIIPCYNAERWIAEAIQSCLDQTHRPIEIIVIDDGSTDGSLEVIKGFGDAVRWETGPNRGGNAARNRGLALAKGEYIQFLDADDYLLPEKIERDVTFIEQSRANVVYGDVRGEYHLPDGTTILGDVLVTGAKHDVLEALLMGWGVSTHALFFRKNVLLSVQGWDEQIHAAQERDLLISVALTGAKIAYQPGCFAVFRQYGLVTVSTSNPLKLFLNYYKVLYKAEKALIDRNGLSVQYKKALAAGYFAIARAFFDMERSFYTYLLWKTLCLNREFKPAQSSVYNLLHRCFGFAVADMLASCKRRIKFRFFFR